MLKSGVIIAAVLLGFSASTAAANCVSSKSYSSGKIRQSVGGFSLCSGGKITISLKSKFTTSIRTVYATNKAGDSIQAYLSTGVNELSSSTYVSDTCKTKKSYCYTFNTKVQTGADDNYSISLNNTSGEPVAIDYLWY